MDSLEKFDYSCFGKFMDKIISNPDIVKKRDFIAEKAYDWFEISESDIKFISKNEIMKLLYKYVCLSYYIFFHTSTSKISQSDQLNTRQIEKMFPDEIFFLKKNVENWQYLMTFYGGMVEGLLSVLKTSDGKPLKSIIPGMDDATDEENGLE